MNVPFRPVTRSARWVLAILLLPCLGLGGEPEPVPDAQVLLDEVHGRATDEANARFLLGVRAAEGGDEKAAREALQRAAREHPLLGAYAAYRLALLEEKLERPERALELFRGIERSQIASALYWSSRLRAADLLARLKRPGEARAQWEKILASAPPDSVALCALDRLAAEALRAHAWSEAEGWMAQSWQLDPLDPRAHDARKRSASLVVRGLARAPEEAPEERLRQAAAVARARRWNEALALLKPLASERMPALVRAEAAIWRGRAAFSREDPSHARRHFREAMDALADAARAPVAEAPAARAAELRGEALLGLLRLELQEGARDRILERWGDLRREAPGSAAYARGTILTAAEMRGAGETATAAGCLRAWLSDRPDAPEAAEVRWDLVRTLLGARDWDGARPLLDETIAQGDPAYLAGALFWASRAARERGDAAAASRFARELTRTAPLSYYGHRLRAMGMDGGAWPADVGRPAPLAAQAASFTLQFPGDVAPAGWRRAMILRALGLTAWARLELVDLLEEGWPAGVIGPGLMATAIEGGLIPAAVRATRDLCDAELQAGRSDLPPAAWAAAFPLPFREEIESAAADAGLDPYLLWAAAREESEFDPGARSGAGAVGLLQLMPATARAVAHRNGRRLGRGEILDPRQNLWLGARYLGELLERWPRNVPLALAAYNAGPARAARWWTAAGEGDVDLFVETIPFRETRVYVKTVLRAYGEYARIYGGARAVDWAPGAPTSSASPATSAISTPQGNRAR